MLSNTYRAKSTTPDLLAIDLGAGQLTYSNLGARHTADLDGGGEHCHSEQDRHAAMGYDTPGVLPGLRGGGPTSNPKSIV